MWTFITVALGWLCGNKVVQAIALNVVKDLVQHGKELTPIILTKIKEVAPNKEMTGTEKFTAVTDTLAADFPAIGRSALNTIVQSTYAAWVNPEVKEVV